MKVQKKLNFLNKQIKLINKHYIRIYRRFYHNYLIFPLGSKCKIERDLRNKIILITGGSKGIGQETIKQLSKYQCTIIFGCRNKPQQFLEQLSKTQKSFIKYIPLDLQDWQSINYFINEIKKEYNKIDILINNAAIMGTLNREYTKYGLESQFGTNYIGPFYLTQQLLPLLKQSQSPRVINVSSIAHTYQDLQFNDINCDRWANSILWSRYYTYRAYGNTKLALILNSQEFSKRTGIKSCSLHPGVVLFIIFIIYRKVNYLWSLFFKRNRNFGTKHSPCIRSDILKYQLSSKWCNILMTILWPIFAYFTKDCYYGCQTTLYCIMLNDEEFVDGGFYKDLQLSKPKYTSDRKAMELWDFTHRLIEKIKMNQKKE